jgi:hypothetical protein
MSHRSPRRTLEPVVRRAAREFPAEVLTGPRPSGRTTPPRGAGSRRCVSLVFPDARAPAVADPRGFPAAQPPPVLFDAIPHARDLLPHIRQRVDARRSPPGPFLLAGSRNQLLQERVTESLAGRAMVLRLLPLFQREAAGHPAVPLPRETGAGEAGPRGPSHRQPWAALLRGGSFERVAGRERDAASWHARCAHGHPAGVLLETAVLSEIWGRRRRTGGTSPRSPLGGPPRGPRWTSRRPPASGASGRTAGTAPDPGRSSVPARRDAPGTGGRRPLRPTRTGVGGGRRAPRGRPATPTPFWARAPSSPRGSPAPGPVRRSSGCSRSGRPRPPCNGRRPGRRR